MERWEGRVALVTGASSGIGAATCVLLVRSGMKVVGAARGVEHIKSLSENLKGAKGSLLPVKCDLTKEEDIRNLFDTVKKAFGGVDVCINNAGLSNGKGILGSTVEEMHELTDVNVIAVCICSQLAIQSMGQRGVDDGHIININSTVGHSVSPAASKFYTATKHAVRAITEGLRQEMREAKSHIRISEVSPGRVETQFGYRAHGEEKAKRFYASMKSLEAQDVADSILHVLSSPKHVEINDIIMASTDQPF